ncbi:MAG: hypothetical protein J6C37_06415, partial [Roseburia sp.]|nr:hypothetical protein [Roseburia sp.]
MKKRLLAMLLCLVMLATAIIPDTKTVQAADPTLYVFDLESFINELPSTGTVRYDYLKFATALQGLANRETPQIYYLFQNNSFAKSNGNVDMDEYWLNKLSEDGEYLTQFNQVIVTDFWELVDKVSSSYNGLVLWDSNVPATSNVASTVAGADNLLPVRFDEAEGSLYSTLLTKGFTTDDVKVNLVDKFTGTGTIPDSTTESTGSAKNDAYIWAKEQYLDTGKTSEDLMTYSVDAWIKDTSVTSDRDAEFVSIKIPKMMKAGSTVEVEVVVKNVGTETWSEDGMIRLGSLADASSSFYWTNTVGDVDVHDRMFIAKGDTVAPGETYTFRVNITAPAAAGNYPFEIKMVKDGVAWFGDSLSRTIQVVADGSSSGGSSSEGSYDTTVKAIDLTASGVITSGAATTERNAEFVEVKLPEAMEAGSTATVSVTVKNLGTEVWEETHIGADPGTRLGRSDGFDSFAWQDDDGDSGVKNRAFIADDVQVGEGETNTFEFQITAPSTPGKATFKVQMIRDGVAWFGPVLTYEIDVFTTDSGSSGEEEADTSVKTVDLTASGVITSGAATTERNAEFVEVKLPDTMVAGSRATVSVTVKNLGTEVWEERGGADPGTRLGRCDDSAVIKFADAKQPVGADGNRAYLTTGETCAQNETHTFEFEIIAPSTPGVATIKMQMIRDGIAWFGQILTKDINIVAQSSSGSDDQTQYTDEDFAPVFEDLSSDSGEGVYYTDLMNTMLPNADYYISKKAFFWDLSPDGTIAPIDDRTQPVGTDLATLNAILASQQERAGGEIFTVSGFVPWWMKYTSTSDPSQSTMGDVASEWKMVDIISSYRGQVDADAYGMTSLSNASVFSKVPLNSELKQSNDKGESDTTVYDPDTEYIMFYMGDYDAGSWTSGCLPILWDDEERGTRDDVPLAWPICADLSNRVPQVFNYLYETASANDYFVAGDNGTGYLNPMWLDAEGLEVWKEHNIASNEKFDIDITGFLIAGNAGLITDEVQKAYSEISPVGVVYQGSVSAGKEVNYGTPFVSYYDIGNQIKSGSAASVASTINSRMKGTGQFHVFRSILTSPSAIYDIVDALKANYPDTKFKVLDPYTFMELFEASEGGVVTPAPITYEAQEATAITVDGVADEEEWADAEEILVSVDAEDVKKHGTNWNVDSSDPLEAKYKVKWDSENLYVVETISDDALLPMTDTSAMNYLKNDATMLFLDLNGSKSSGYSAGDYAVYYALDSNNELVVFLRDGQNGALIERRLSDTEYTAAAKVDGNTAVIELALPWSLFQTVPFTPEAGKSVGMSILVIDHDTTNDNGGRQIMWCGAGDDQIGWAAMKFVAVEKKTVNVTVEVGDNGTVTPGTDTYELDKEYTFTVTPDEGYEVGSVTV